MTRLLSRLLLLVRPAPLVVEEAVRVIPLSLNVATKWRRQIAARKAG